ncbi:hypothetical protein [Listeria innocua]|uniref:hypothetical protein n=1 Tax=Listeria innocua TaxID=1642 RepID=UPI001628CCC7|nr:hypothetical protein [Listeria innocua]MBC1385522.1 hypothetical protein [Listeria innocua]
MTDSKLKSYFKKFDSISLAKSIYTITSWISNRNYIGMVDKMNKTFIEIEDEGETIEISTYEDFKKMFQDLIPHLKDSYGSPEGFASDTGEVRFYSGGSFKKIFIGNGSENIYEACFFIENIVQSDEYLKSMWQEILLYEDFILSKLYLGEFSHSTEFECPPKEYFENVFDIYESLMNPKLKLFFQDFKSSNSELYDFFTKKNGYPIFLPVIKESFLEKIEQLLPVEHLKDSAWRAVINQVKDNFLPIPSREIQAVFSVILIEKKTNLETVIENSFVIWDISHVVIFVPDDLNEELLDSLKLGIRDENYTLAGFSANGDLIKVNFESAVKMIIQKVEDVDISPNKFKMRMFTKTDEAYIDMRGLMGIINFASDINEIVEFIKFSNDKVSVEKIMNASGITSYFQIWQGMNKVIIEGSLDAMIVVPPYQSVGKTIEFFSSDMKYYPYDAGINFSKIHHWNCVTEAKSDLSLNAKGGIGSADIFMAKDKSIVYQELYFIIEDIDEKIVETITSFHEIIINELNENKELILSLYRKNVLEINLVSERVLKKNATKLSIIESKYCKKLIINSADDSQILLVKPDWEKIVNDNIISKEKSFENELILSFLMGGNFSDEKLLEKEIKKSNTEQRTSSISQIEISYFIDPHLNFDSPKISAFKNIRKVMSKIIEKMELETKEYEESEISGVVRRFRNEIRNDLIKKIEIFDKIDLHKKLLNIYSAILFQINIHQERINEFQVVDYLREDSLNEFREQAIKLREESKTYRQVLEYLIEENLICDRINIDRIITNQDLDELIAYSKWILDFQTMSDSVSYGANGWNKLEIREDHVLEIKETDKYVRDAELLKKLRYEYGDYSYRDHQMDKKMFDLVNNAFQIETQISFEALFTTLTLLYSNSYVTDIAQQEEVKVTNNIVETPINIIANLFLLETKLPIEEFFKVLTFITINVDQISDNNGVIPVWEKKKRKNKLSAQPVLLIENNLIFSPISLYELKKSWFQGMMSFILPYNVGLEETTKAIDKWKKYYEHKIVMDLASLFEEAIYEVYSDKELYKLDPKGNHPHDLGDYDLIVINKEKKEILLFEVKYMRLSQTMKDLLGDQGTYFLNRKAKAKKFVRRVDYFQEHVNQIMNNLGFEGNFVVKKYFLSNKNIRSFFKKYPFTVIGFKEFEQTYFN